MEMSKLVIILEDNTAINKLFSTLLTKVGFKVQSFFTGKDFLNSLNELKPDLILLDMLLPDYTGLELIQKLSENPSYSKIPAIAVTGFATEYTLEGLKEKGFSDYITKPINTKTFVEQISKYLN